MAREWQEGNEENSDFNLRTGIKRRYRYNIL